MKRIKIISLYCILGIIPFACYAEEDPYLSQCRSSVIKYGSFQNDDDYFCYVSEQTDKATRFKCFKSDSDYCVTNTAVCILGLKTDLSKVVWTDTTSCAPKKVNPGGVWEMECHKEYPKSYINGTYTIGKALLGYRTCAVSYEGPSVSDTWFHYDPQFIQDCKSIKWGKPHWANVPARFSKTHMVLVYEDKPVLSDDNKPSEYLVRHYDRNIFPEICVGYYCPDANGKYTEPCDDGTCRDSNGNCEPKEEPKPTQKTKTKKPVKKSTLIPLS